METVARDTPGLVWGSIFGDGWMALRALFRAARPRPALRQSHRLLLVCPYNKPCLEHFSPSTSLHHQPQPHTHTHTQFLSKYKPTPSATHTHTQTVSLQVQACTISHTHSFLSKTHTHTHTHSRSLSITHTHTQKTHDSLKTTLYSCLLVLHASDSYP